ncbi:MAG: cellulase family glycosylhydrolase [Candidatus Omnitrophota bacterium]|nr:cellulase family glycosylhydrolase [Candidatus Omnitrophota bacterium]
MIKKLPVILRGVLLFLIFFLSFSLATSFAQIPEELEFNLDLNSPVVSLPKIYRSSVDLSGRGKQHDKTLPQTLAASDALAAWQADLGFRNFYRIQYNLWEIQQLINDKDSYQKLLSNYEEIIKKISDSGGTVILDLFGTPDGLGTVLDKNSAPHNLKIYKELIKNTIRKFSCDKKYNIWYEVWNAPDIGDFFIGQRSEYLNLYRIVGEAVKELRQETKITIPLGGPSVSSWFRNIEPNNILTPERSLIYELIKYCYSYRLPLDFISWHAYSSDPAEEKQDTIYNKPFVKLIREWLTYFKFNSNIPLLVSEWSFDGSANILAERAKFAYISASYIPGRLKNMYEAGIDYQTYFCLEDFGDNEAGAIRNLGIFSFELARPENKGYAKANYNVWRMLGLLGQDLFTAKFSDEFVGVISTKSPDYLALLIYNYIDPQAAMNYISHNIVYLNSAEQKAILNIVKSDRMKKILTGQLNLATLRLSVKTKGMLGRAIELNSLANKFSTTNRKIKVSLKGVKDIYVLSKYVMDSNCSRNCEFKPSSENDVDFNQGYVETMELSPYSVQLLVFKKKPAPPEVKPEEKPAEVKPAEIKPAASLASGSQTTALQAEVKPEEKPPLKEISNAEIK